MSVLYATGRGYSPTTPTEMQTVITAKHYQPDQSKRPVIACHSAAANSWSFAQFYTTSRHIIRRIAERGMAVHCSDQLNTQHFGNPASVVRVGESVDHIRTATWNPKQDKVGLFFESMGALSGLNWARANPSLVAAIAGVIPVPDLQDLHDNRGFAATIDSASAYGSHAGYLTAQPTSDPAAAGNQAALAGIPMKLWVSDDDPAAVPSIVQAYADSVNAAGGDCEVISIGAVGHDATTMDPEIVTEFLLEHA